MPRYDYHSTRASSGGSNHMRNIALIVGGILAAFFLVVGLSYYTFGGTPIKFNEAAVLVVERGPNAGVQDRELGTGRFLKWPWERKYVVLFPTVQTPYAWDGAENGRPCFNFSIQNGVPVRMCLRAMVQIDRNRASDIVSRYQGAIGRGTTDQGYALDAVVYGPVQQEIQNALLQHGAPYTAERLYADGGVSLVQAVFADPRVQARFRREGINILSLNLAGRPSLPESVEAAIVGTLRAEQEARQKQAEVARARAEAEIAVAAARGRAESLDIEGQAINRNPQVLRLREIERSRGICPLSATTCVVGGDVSALVGQH